MSSKLKLSKVQRKVMEIVKQGGFIRKMDRKVKMHKLMHAKFNPIKYIDKRTINALTKKGLLNAQSYK